MDSQASKHVNWCLKKAEKEIEGLKNQKRKAHHRGLLKVEPNKKLALEHVEKARHNLEVFKLLRKNNSSDWSITAGFYTLYHCFLAIAIKQGYESKNQTCTIALMELLQEQGKISIDKGIIEFMKYEEEKKNYGDSLIELREDYTYGVDIEVKDEEQLDKIENLCVEFIDVVKDIVYGRGERKLFGIEEKR
ncbi:MAG: HEPN domain-containing protein [Nanoarchaeota archaeon]|nr:HEPN domain-containing protein [Nanoarchaeota archaeon]